MMQYFLIWTSRQRVIEVLISKIRIDDVRGGICHIFLIRFNATDLQFF